VIVLAEDSSSIQVCSGTLVDKNAVLTAYHCVDSSRKVGVIWPYGDGRRSPYSGSLQKGSKERDLAILTLDRPVEGGRVAKVSDRYVVGQPVALASTPLGIPLLVTFGYISGLTVYKFADYGTLYQVYMFVDITADSGSSGGGVLDQEGNVVGVYVRSVVGTNGRLVGMAVAGTEVLGWMKN
jgi:S1-C subfamily serine protease